MNTIDRLREAFRFHLEWGGYATPPGRAACALISARAELRLRDLIADDRAEVSWEFDDEPYDPGDVVSAEEAERLFETGEWNGPYGCRVRVGDVEDSVWGIVLGRQDLDDPYRRVTEADIAGSVFSQIDEATRDEFAAAIRRKVNR